MRIYEENSVKVFYKLDRNGDIERTRNLLEQKIKSYEQPTVKIAFIGPPGVGKSTFINFLIGGNQGSILPVSNNHGKGCTRVPIKCCFSNEQKYKVIIHTPEPQPPKIFGNRYRALEFLMEQDENKMTMIKLILPITTELSSKYQRIYNFEFVDLVGVPDNLNKKAFELNKMEINNEVHGIFLIKSTERGMPDISHIENIYKCDGFNSTSLPKLVIASLSESKHENFKELIDIL